MSFVKTPASSFPSRRGCYRRCAGCVVVAVSVFHGLSSAAAPAPAPDFAGKIYATEVNGTALIRVNGRIQPLKPKTAYPASGIALETQPGSAATLVLSNGTGVTLGPATRIEVKHFEQEPFKPMRTDFEQEPSVSDTRLEVVFGTISIATNKLASGSNLHVETPQAEVSAFGGRLVVTVSDAGTNVWVLEGSCTLRGDDTAMPKQLLRAGDMAAATRGAAGQPEQTIVRVEKISSAKLVALDDQLAEPSFARKIVYFEVKELPADASNASGGAASPQAALAEGDKAAGAPVDAFGRSDSTPTLSHVIVPVAVVPIELPVNFTISPARILSGG